jgi:hypothetical protein
MLPVVVAQKVTSETDDQTTLVAARVIPPKIFGRTLSEPDTVSAPDAGPAATIFPHEGMAENVVEVDVCEILTVYVPTPPGVPVSWLTM